MSVKVLRECVYALLACLLIASTAAAQAVSTASLSGTVKDEGGGVLPGVTVTATQTATGQVRTTVTDATGVYTLQSLPVGPYKVQFELQGFKSFVQSGLVLQVGGNQTLNATLGVGTISETVQVQAAAPLVETRNQGFNQVIDNQKVQELPLNGRQATDLILLSGVAVQSGSLTGIRGGVGTTQTVAIAGGLANGASYLLDGGYHNDPMNNAPAPFPFPEALQEFKVETSALTAQYGLHSAGAVNAITKSGTNTFSGTAFEFYRDARLNAISPFAAKDANGNLRNDGLKRNQTGGTLGGPIVENKLFFFGGYQGTFLRQTPTSAFEFVPTPAMLAGDFSTIASAACNAGRSIKLKAPFVNNHIDPSQFSPASLKLESMLPVPTDPCGKVFYDQVNNSDEHMAIGKIDYSLSGNHTMFGRMEYQKQDQPASVGQYVNETKSTNVRNRLYSFVFGDTLVMRNNTVNSIRATAYRGDYHKYSVDIVDAADLGIPVIPPVPGLINVAVTGGFSVAPSAAQPGDTPSRAYQISDDLTTVRGQHTLGIGAEYVRTAYNSTSYLRAVGSNSFTGSVTGLGLADFLLGRESSFGTGVVSGNTIRANYIGIYGE
ncbi:MAG TPA: carboxypeptidase-like regulatory domain-containing protein, partial [Vicinamibacterales bacterium]|nr:carboxypeptidase-like regulatory domain-containing protein [Vicinamibacterales bacterium]